MACLQFKSLRPLEGKMVVIRPVKGEAIHAELVHVDEEYPEVVIDVIEANQRPTRLGRGLVESGLIIPIEFIESIREDDRAA